MTTKPDIGDWLSEEELENLKRRSAVHGLSQVVLNWLVIAGLLALVAAYPNPLTIILAVILIGGRQLGLAILMHEAAHRALLPSPLWNDRIGQWLCAAPVLADVAQYRSYHLSHHKLAGTDADPDYPNYQHYPVARASLVRKLMRDTVGITGVKNLLGAGLMYAGVYDYDLSYKPKHKHKVSWLQGLKNLSVNMRSQLLFQLAFFTVLWALGFTALYLVWLVALLTSFSLFTRIRNAAEHAAVPDLLSPDPRLHTRTTLARWWERLTFAPNYVNYHLEHHLLPAVPAWQLPRLHQLLKDRGALDSAEVVDGYAAVLRKLVVAQ